MNQTANSTSRTRRRWLSRLAFWIIAVAGVIVLIGGGTLMFGAVAGEEFNPQTFERRTFLYYQIPLIRLQITPIWREDKTNSLESKLRTNKLLPPRSPGKPRWDLVRSMRSLADVTQGDAAILCMYLDATDEDGDLYWETWTDDNPKLAKILWAAVAQVARQQLYFFTPEMIDLAATADPKSLQADLNALLVRRYRDLALAQQLAGSHETAVELMDQAIGYSPSDPELTRIRDESLKAIAESAPDEEGESE